MFLPESMHQYTLVLAPFVSIALVIVVALIANAIVFSVDHRQRTRQSHRLCAHLLRFEDGIPGVPGLARLPEANNDAEHHRLRRAPRARHRTLRRGERGHSLHRGAYRQRDRATVPIPQPVGHSDRLRHRLRRARLRCQHERGHPLARNGGKEPQCSSFGPSHPLRVQIQTGVMQAQALHRNAVVVR
jgi:hypothetical protein